MSDVEMEQPDEQPKAQFSAEAVEQMLQSEDEGAGNATCGNAAGGDPAASNNRDSTQDEAVAAAEEAAAAVAAAGRTTRRANCCYRLATGTLERCHTQLAK
jgi:hypothetical protein